MGNQNGLIVLGGKLLFGGGSGGDAFLAELVGGDVLGRVVTVFDSDNHTGEIQLVAYRIGERLRIFFYGDVSNSLFSGSNLDGSGIDADTRVICNRDGAAVV